MAKPTKMKPVKDPDPKEIKDLQLDKINVVFNLSTLQSILDILTMESSIYRSFKALRNINSLFNNINISKYKDNLKACIWAINYFSKKWIDGFVNRELIWEGAKRDKEYTSLHEQVIFSSVNRANIISPAQAKLTLDLVSEALQYGFLAGMKDYYESKLSNINLNDPGEFRKLVENLFMVSKSLLDIKHMTNLVASKITFNTSDIDSIRESILQTIDSLKTSNNIFKTGIQRLNTLLSPGYMNGRVYVYLGLPGSGKAQPDDTPIPTPIGFKRLDELKIGDKVFNLNGKPVNVIGIYPQGVQETYKITFTDGRSTRCNKDHLWYTFTKHGTTGEFRPIIRTLSDMMDDYEYIAPGSPDKVHHKYIIPNNDVAQFNAQPISLDPWVMGYIIGNGCCLEPAFKISAPNDDAPIKIGERLGIFPYCDHLTDYSYFFRRERGTKDRISTREIIGHIPEVFKKYSHEKRIPEEYIFNTKEIRMELLRGLMDSDGSITRCNKGTKYPYFQVRYDTTSIGLVKDLSVLLESLGIGYISYPARVKDERSSLQYAIGFNIPNIRIASLFSIGSKYQIALEAWMYREKRNYEHIRIARIEKVEDTSQRCILVDDRLHIYLTEQFIPTHNSLILLKSALDIRKYNPDFKPKTSGMRPAVLYITMENLFTESVERIWNMCFDENLANYTPAEALEKISSELGISKMDEDHSSKTSTPDILDLIEDEDQGNKNIEIVMKYFSYREINTDDLFTIIQDLKDENIEVCALILDYIKRIRPAEALSDNVKLELNRVINELKALSAIEDIPVITAHQMNRIAAATVDSAARQGKGDITKLVGREHVGDAWEVVETADWAAVLNIEYKPGTDDKYMIFNVVKRRRIETADQDMAKYTYIAHPFSKRNGLRLIDDKDSAKILSLTSLNSDVDIVDKEKVNAVSRLRQMEHSEFVYDTDE